MNKIAFSPKVNSFNYVFFSVDILQIRRFSAMNNDLKTSWLASNVSGNNSSHLYDSDPQLNRIYVFSPVDDASKWALCALFSTIGCLGFFGNCLLVYFFWKKPKANPIQRSTFMKNFYLYVRSMSLV